MRVIYKLTILFLHGLLFGQPPQGYYSTAENTSGQTLRANLHDIIDDHDAKPYTSGSTDTWDILKEADIDPNNSSNVFLIYTGASVDASQEYGGGSGWNREHVWPTSRGDFKENLPEYTDVHNLRASNINVNSTRKNYTFDNCDNCDSSVFNNLYSTASGVWEPRDEDKGDVARIIFYMDIRYEGNNGERNFEVVEDIPPTSSKLPYHGVLSTLLQWHEQDPVDDFERNRNNVIYSYQGNRNPFIDYPNLVDFIWGNQQQVSWSSTLSINSQYEPTDIVFPNPVYLGYLKINPDLNPHRIEIFDVHGKKIKILLSGPKIIKTPSVPGIYFLKLYLDNSIISKKILVGKL
jgi:endonuclease I